LDLSGKNYHITFIEMTPKEKAQELVDKHISYSFDLMPTKFAKNLALVSVDEILNEYWSHDTKRRDWWQEVKKEIEKL
jgi:hypothetical protein